MSLPSTHQASSSATQKTSNELQTLAFPDTQEIKQNETTVTLPSDEKSIVDTYFVQLDADQVEVSESSIGNGGYASVVAAKYKGDENFAFKKFKSTTLVESAKHRLRLEVAIARMLGTHRNIHKTIGGVFAKSKNGILMELAEKDLQTFCKERGELIAQSTSDIDSLRRQQAAYYRQLCSAFLSIASALQHMHDSNMIHCDVKPQNILVRKVLEPGSSEARLEFTLCDFGSVRLANPKELTQPKTVSGTTHYLPPESLSLPKDLVKTFNQTTQSGRPLAYRQAMISARTDVWSLGCTMLTAMNYGENPIFKLFPTVEEYQQHMLPFSNLAKTTSTSQSSADCDSPGSFTVAIQSDCPPMFLSLISKCLVMNPKHRASLSQVIKGLLEIDEQLAELTAVGSFQEAHICIAPDRDAMRRAETEEMSMDEVYRQFAKRQAEQERRMQELVDMFNEHLRVRADTMSVYDNDSNYYNEEYEDVQAILSRPVQELTRRVELHNVKPTGRVYQSSGKLNGLPVFEGPRGGQFVINDKGSKVYVTEKDTAYKPPKFTAGKTSSAAAAAAAAAPGHQGTFTGTYHQSSGSANGKPLYEGQRGGTYYINESGNKTYVKPTSSSSSSGLGAAAASAASSSSEGRFTGMHHQSSGRANGKPLYEGARGGLYYINDSGNKTYVSSTSSSSSSYGSSSYGSSSSSSRGSGVATGSTYQSSGSANGSTLYTGPRGGTYYLTSSGNKVYTSSKK